MCATYVKFSRQWKSTFIVDYYRDLLVYPQYLEIQRMARVETHALLKIH